MSSYFLLAHVEDSANFKLYHVAEEYSKLKGVVKAINHAKGTLCAFEIVFFHDLKRYKITAVHTENLKTLMPSETGPVYCRCAYNINKHGISYRISLDELIPGRYSETPAGLFDISGRL